MIDWWKKAFIENYANFDGRARRSEYWYYVLTNLIIVISGYILLAILALAGGPILFTIGAVIFVLWAIANLIPNLAVIVRRLHDTNKSGWWILISFVPLGGLVLLVFYCLEGDRGKNEYGEDPKMNVSNTINEIGKD
ncbi:MAG: DUF805 domain-containing protein [Flavobacteriaceae bacterium]